MERLVRKYDQSFRRVKVEMSTWNTLQARLVKQFGNAAAILGRLPVLVDANNYGILGEEKSMAMARDLLAAQMESLELTFRGMNSTLGELEKVRNAIEKIWQDGRQLLRSERQQPTTQQLQQRVGPRPSIEDCIAGLHSIYEMHRDEYSLKAALVSALSYETKPEDVMRLQTLLEDQPNIPGDEVQHILDLASAGEGS